MEKSKKRKKAVIAVFIVFQVALLVLWGMVIIEKFCPVYKWETMYFIADKLVSTHVAEAPVRFETLFTTSAQKVNNYNLENALADVNASFINDNGLADNPKYKIISSSADKLTYEVFYEVESYKWQVTVLFRDNGSFDISVNDIGGDAS